MRHLNRSGQQTPYRRFTAVEADTGRSRRESQQLQPPTPPEDPLALIWKAAVAGVEPTATWLLLLEQCQLLELRRDPSPLACPSCLIAVVEVRPNALGEALWSVDKIRDAFSELLGGWVAVQLVEAGQ